MPDEPADFDDEGDLADGFGALLPPEDRLWRHPSELGPPAGAQAGRPLLAATPARAGSWSAGLAGALLATGIVLVATHLAHSAGPDSSSARRALTTAKTATTAAAVADLHRLQAIAGATALVTAGKVGKELAETATRIYKATVLVTATRGARTDSGAGLVIGADCLVVVPAQLVGHGASIDLTLPDGKLVAAHVVGVDTRIGIAVLRCAVGGLVTVPDGTDEVSAHELVVLVYAAPHAVGMSVGLVKAAEQRVATPAGALMDALETDVPYTDVGAALIDGDGEVVGMVVGPLAGGSVATPAWLAFSVARQIAASGHAGRAWLGIAGGSVQAAAGRPAGVKVEAVQRGGAAARAGIRTGDLIESVDGRATDSMTALQAQLYTLRPGTKAVIGVRRGTHSLAAHTTLAAQPAA